MKKILVFVVALFASLVLFPLNVKAASIVASGTCGAQGDNVIWTLDSEGVFTVSGEGAMEDFANSDGGYLTYYLNSQWSEYREQIKSIVVEEGVTQLGMYAFAMLTKLETVQLSSTVQIIKQGTFFSCSLFKISSCV